MACTHVQTRPAVTTDAASIARIYNQGIRERIATFEMEERSESERRSWLAAHDPRYPVLVAVVDGAVMSCAACDAYRSRACYVGVAEFSIYVDASMRGRGVGLTLLEALIDEADAAGL